MTLRFSSAISTIVLATLVMVSLTCGSPIVTRALSDELFEELQQQGRAVRLKIRKGVPFSQTVDLSPFGEFASTVPLWSFVAGKPLSIAESELPERARWRFPTPDGRIEIQRLVISSEGDTGEKWELRFFPNAPQMIIALQARLAGIASEIPADFDTLSIWGDTPSHGNLTLELDGGLVTSEYLWFPGREHIRPITVEVR